MLFDRVKTIVLSGEDKYRDSNSRYLGRDVFKNCFGWPCQFRLRRAT